MAEEFESATATPVRVDGDEDVIIPATLQSAAYHIVQEALNNAAKHARASEIRISVSRQKSDVVVEVRDDGLGFAPGDVRRDGYGMKNMAERARQVDGRLTVRSNPGEGTQIILLLPAS